MKNILYLLILCTFGNRCVAQVNIMLYPPAGIEIKPSDVFRADIQNMTTAPVKIFLEGNIRNRSTGELLVSAKSITFDLAPGSRSVTETSLNPQYTIQSSVVRQTGVFPYGNYELCLKAIRVSDVEEIGSDCREVEAIPQSPPLLISPENQSVINQQYPLLVWLPPMPLGREAIVYDLKLVEMLPNQTPYDAVQRNFALVEKTITSNTNFQYPANAMQLQEDKKYAWRIIAKTSGNNLIGETEVWWFTLKREVGNEQVSTEIPVNENYIIPKYNGDNKVVYVNDLLKVYIEGYPDNLEFKYRILDNKGKLVNSTPSAVTKDGNGRFTINLNDKMSLKNGGLYTLEIQGMSEMTSYIHFQYIKKK